MFLGPGGGGGFGGGKSKTKRFACIKSYKLYIYNLISDASFVF